MAIARAPGVGILVECGRGGLEDVPCRRICELCREQTGVEFEIRYVDVHHATDFALCLQHLDRLFRCATFRRFAEKVTAQRV
jgi:hypothetical protein